MFVEVNKIVKRSDNSLGLEPDAFPIAKIKNFRKWDKFDNENEIVNGNDVYKDDITIVYIYNNDGKTYYYIKIAEPVESFGSRVGGVIKRG